MGDINQYQSLLRAKIKSAIAQAKAASVFTHNGVKGAVLEILIGSLFKPLLPSDIGVGTGQIIDNYKSLMSNQIDIILYDKAILPPILLDEKTGVFPIESVLYTIEVKTTLNATELAVAHESAKKLEKFGYLPGLTDGFGNERNHSIEKVRSVIFALSSDLMGNRLNEAQRYKNFYKDEPPYLRAICVADKEYWFDDGENWRGCQNCSEHDEVLAFLAGVMNSYKGVSRSRHNPLLGKYIFPDVTLSPSVQSQRIARINFKCDSCGQQITSTLYLGTMNITINGTITHPDTCPTCSGKVRSEEGVYKFISGKLIEK